MLKPSALIFLHVPKTGGTTFRSILDQNYQPSETLIFNGDSHPEELERFTKLPESDRAQYRLIKGHLGFGLHRFVPGNSTYVTFLREPVARALSFYYYARSHPDHYLFPLLNGNRVDLKALLSRGTEVELFNYQTRMISGAGNSQMLLSRDALETAKENLSKYFHFVGLTEEFDAGLFLLRRSLGWRLPFYIKKNITLKKPRADEIDVQTLALLREANSFDLELYEFARALFQKKRIAAGASFESELRRFQLLNRVGVRGLEKCQALKHAAKRLIGSRRKSRQLPIFGEIASGRSV